MAIRILSIFAFLFLPHIALSQVRLEDWFPGPSGLSEAEIIPPAFRGEWASSAEMCRDPEGVEKQRISQSGVEYYEGSGRLERVTQSGEARGIRVKLAYEGEGEFWDRVETWTLDPSGDRLTITYDDGPTSWVRCSL